MGDLRHANVVAGRITEDEYEAVSEHIFNSQAKGDILIASSTTQLESLGITDNRVLISSGGLPVWSDTFTIKDIIFSNDGVAQFGTLDGSPTIRGGRVAFPYMLIVQPKDGNRVGEICVIPKGTEDAAFLCVYNADSLSDYGFAEFLIDGNQAHIIGGQAGGGTAPIRLRMWFDTVPGTALDEGLGD